MAKPKGTDDLERITITIPRKILQKIKVEVLKNKAAGVTSSSVSAVIREALERRRE